MRRHEVVDTLIEAARRLGLGVATEYPVLGGRIDVVWLWHGAGGFLPELPLVAFEVESSWRTRKHIKGDFMNLQDLQPALGVIVLLGEGEDVESTRRFAREMVERHSARVEVWSENEVLKLLDSDARVEEERMAPSGQPRTRVSSAHRTGTSPTGNVHGASTGSSGLGSLSKNVIEFR